MKMRMIDPNAKVYLLFIKTFRDSEPVVEGVYSSKENAEFEVDSGERYAIGECGVDRLFSQDKLNFAVKS